MVLFIEEIRLKLQDIQHLNSLTFTLSMNIYNPPNHINNNNFTALPEATVFEHVWNIDDKSIISEIHSATCVYGFASKIFEFCGLKWFCTFYPNGSRLKRLDKSNSFLYLASAPNYDVELYVKLTMMFRDRIDENITEYNMNTEGLGHAHSFGTMNDLREMDHYFFVTRIQLIDVYNHDIDINDNNHEIKIYEPVKSNFEWNIEFEQDWDSYQTVFNRFGIDWDLKIEQNGNVALGIDDAVFDGDDKCDMINIRYCMHIKQLKIRYFIKALFNKKNLIRDWPNHEERVDVERLKSLEICTINICIEIIDVWNNGDNITQNFKIKK